MNKSQIVPSQLSVPMFYILLALAKEPRHGYEIMKKVEEESGGKITLGPGTLYGAIKRLLEEEFIVEVKKDTRRRYYQTTTKGKKIVLNELERYSQVLTQAKRAGVLALGNF